MMKLKFTFSLSLALMMTIASVAFASGVKTDNNLVDEMEAKKSEIIELHLKNAYIKAENEMNTKKVSKDSEEGKNIQKKYFDEENQISNADVNNLLKK
jgi:hypothetical protein